MLGIGVNGFYVKLAALIEADRRSTTRIAEDMGQRPDYLDSILLEQPDLSFTTVREIANTLHVSLAFFADEGGMVSVQSLDPGDARNPTPLANLQKRVSRSASRPTIDTVTSWWLHSGGLLLNDDFILPHVDILNPLKTNDIPSVSRVGSASLAALALGSSKKSRLQEFIEAMNDADLEDLKKSMIAASTVGSCILSSQFRRLNLEGRSVDLRFLRLVIPVKDETGKPYVLNFSTLPEEVETGNPSGFKM